MEEIIFCFIDEICVRPHMRDIVMTAAAEANWFFFRERRRHLAVAVGMRMLGTGAGSWVRPRTLPSGSTSGSGPRPSRACPLPTLTSRPPQSRRGSAGGVRGQEASSAFKGRSLTSADSASSAAFSSWRLHSGSGSGFRLPLSWREGRGRGREGTLRRTPSGNSSHTPSSLTGTCVYLFQNPGNASWAYN